MSVLSGSEVAKFCSSYRKVNPNGVDLAPKEVKSIPVDSKIYLHGEERGYVEKASGRVTDSKEVLNPDAAGFYDFASGRLYELRFPKVSIPADCTGFAFPRSTVNRLGIIKLESAVFDSGYSGEPTQTIFTPLDARVHKDEALIQLVFIRNEAPSKELYSGRYQNEASG
ncbi:MAG: deoxycytidine deaminase [Thaumarchaeota archaeon]|nr:deoxycytidine deaminase [Nitrososphaerota archaeon]